MSDKENKDLENEQSKQPEEQSDEAGQAEQVEQTEQPEHAELSDDNNEPQHDNDPQHDNEHELEVTPASPTNEVEASTTSNRSSVGGKVWPIISLVLAVALIVVLVTPLFGGSKDETVATVNGVKITKAELYDKLVKGGGTSTLQGLIQKELVNQEVAKQNITIDQTDIDAKLDTFIESYGSKEALVQALDSYGMTLDDLLDDISMNEKLTKLLESQITITDDQIKETFELYKESFNTPEQVRASIILVATEEEANDIIKQLKEGADFAELAKSKSLDTLTKDNGGDTDFFGRGEKEEAVENVVFNLQKDEISGAIQTMEGYQVIKLTDRKEAEIATLEGTKEEIREGLLAQQVSEKVESYLAELESKGDIINKLTETADTTK